MTISRLILAGAAAAVAVCTMLLDSHFDRPTQLMLGGMGVLYIVQVITGLIEHARLVRSLQALTSQGQLGGEPVQHVESVAPFVAGILRPRVYCDPALARRLTRQQQRAVALHERHHMLRRDPLRLQLSNALRPYGALIPAIRARLALHEARCEVAADRYALDNGVTRADIAGALLVMLEDERLIQAPGFLSAAEIRLRALNGDPPEAAAQPWEIISTVVLTSSWVLACLYFL